VDTLSRRDFLKVASVAVGAVVAGKGVNYLSKVKPVNRAVFLTTGWNAEQIVSEVPPELKGKEIPVKNESYRPPLLILNEAIALYEKWKETGSSLAELSYVRPPNYLDVPSLRDKLKNLIKTDRNINTSDPNFLPDLPINLLKSNDQQGHCFIEFTGSQLRNASEISSEDPGTGLMRQVREEYRKVSGTEFDAFLADTELSKEEYLKVECLNWFKGAGTFVEREVAKSGRQSTSLLFAYFLYRNKGNLMESLWDTTLWLKIAARNDLETLNFYPKRAGAQLLTRLFKDEFSLKISANWVEDNTQLDDALLNDIGVQVGMQYKDFMPINRVGGLYHAWNIIALAGSMSPLLIKPVVRGISNVSFDKNPTGPNGEYYDKRLLSTAGREKIMADLKVVSHADEFTKLLKKYEK